MREIETRRLQLRKPRESDLEDLAMIYQDPKVMQYRANPNPISKSETQQKLQQLIHHWNEYNFGRWAIVEKTTGKFIGHAGLEVVSVLNEIEINYLLAQAQWNQGFATEAGIAIAAFAFTKLELSRLVALANPDNLASRRVMEKLGMRYEKEIELYDHDWVYYSLNRDQWNDLSSESMRSLN